MVELHRLRTVALLGACGLAGEEFELLGGENHDEISLTRATKPLESHALRAERNFRNRRPYFEIEAVPVHAQIGRGVPESDQSR